MVSMLDLKNALFEGGVVGAGGAGFPTHAKLSDQADTVILNCAECEPLIKVDRQLMVDYINEILSGMQMMVEAMGAKEGIIALKKSYTASIEAVKSNIGNYKNLRLHILPDIYPAGDEVVLIYETTDPERTAPVDQRKRSCRRQDPPRKRRLLFRNAGQPRPLCPHPCPM